MFTFLVIIRMGTAMTHRSSLYDTDQFNEGLECYENRLSALVVMI